MKVRNKMMIHLLVIALVPLIASSFLYWISMRRMGNNLVSEARQYLDDSAYRYLQNQADHFSRLLRRDSAMLLLALEFQAREVERRLTDPAPSPGIHYLAEAYDTARGLLPGMEISDRHFRVAPDGQLTPIPVSYQVQVYFLPNGVDRPSVATDMDRLATMTEAYRFIQKFQPDMFHWQYTALESGLHSRFPGHGGIPADYEPRSRLWYQNARQSGAPTRQLLIDATTGTLMLTHAMPVLKPGGEFAGVTAIDVRYDQALSDWVLPEDWGDQADTLVVRVLGDDRLEVIVQSRLTGKLEGWREEVDSQVLTSNDQNEMAGLIEDVRNGKSGTRKMPYQGREALWAYGALGEDEPFPLLIVPYDLVVKPAARAENQVRGHILQGLQIAGFLLIGVVIWVILTAVHLARAVTLPVTSLAGAAGRLAQGDYDVHVEIRTGDELEDLGQTFNQVGPQLREREAMKRSLELAREIQQLLLPERAPQIPGLEVFGSSLYCDETGGDYFDYLDLGGGRLGVMVGDVVGHGVGAALLMASASGVIRSHAANCGEDLERLITTLNRFLAEDVGDVRFMTLFYTLLDVERKTMCWVSAGHGPVYRYLGRNRSLDEIPASGMPVGIMGDAEYPSTSTGMLESGDFLAIGTDGIWEARNSAGEMFGVERFSDILRDHAQENAETIHAAVMSAVAAFRGEEAQEDDITLVVVKAT